MPPLAFVSSISSTSSNFLSTYRNPKYFTSKTKCYPIERKRYHSSINKRIIAKMEDNSTVKRPVDIPLELSSLKVVGLGMCGIDMLAQVDHFPKPDEKIRTTSTQIRGGGNTSNTITAIRRLGIDCHLITRVGNDVYGDLAIKELQSDGINTSNVIQKDGINTPFSYVIVDSTNGTRTCIATVSEEDLSVTEVNENMLENASMLVLDGRHTLGALQMAKYAKKLGVPVLLDIERDRPYIRDLMPFADYIISNRRYPFAYAPQASDRIDALKIMLENCNAKFVISTLGEGGSILLQAEENREKGSGLNLFVQTKTHICRSSGKRYEIIECPCCAVGNIVDTTGAGDAFIGGIVYGIICKMERERMLSLASHLAAKKIEGSGARDGLPRRENIPSQLLSTLPSFSV